MLLNCYLATFKICIIHQDILFMNHLAISNTACKSSSVNIQDVSLSVVEYMLLHIQVSSNNSS